MRKAREQVKQMVMDGISSRRISAYLHRWTTWWVRTSETWGYQELLEWFLTACWAPNPAAIYAAGLLTRAKESSVQQRPEHYQVFESGSEVAA
ncbi:TPA: hypothetical protein JBD64_15390 [Legionella pneumophila subsp. pneumophila]|nr:hypothetical protein [Legionella pneumophila subsp. pneumophila]